MENNLCRYTFEWDGLDKFIPNNEFSNFVGNSESFVKVKLPNFVSNYGIGDEINFPKKFVEPHDYENIVINYKKCNWLGASEYLASLEFEKANFVENIISVSRDVVNKNILHEALVNRYLLFLRDYLAYTHNKNEIIGKIGKPKIYLTHDVDSIKVNFSLKLRQYFHTKIWPNFNNDSELNFIKEIILLEKKYNTQSIFFLNGAKKFKLPLFDPSYKLKDLNKEIEYFNKNKIQYGIHPGILSSFFHFALKSEIKNFNKFSDVPYIMLRNHWLSHFKKRTWKIHEKLNVTHDFSLGFNDTPGLRNFSLLEYKPLESVKTIPMIFMDGQVHNYLKGDKDSVITTIRPLIQELKNVGGVASINFHQRFFHSYYGYKETYEKLLDYLSEEDIL